MIYLSQPPKKIIQITLLFAIGLIAVSFLMRIADGEYKKKPEKLEQETHDGLSDLEQYVYDCVGSYVYFEEPHIDESVKTAELYLIQTEDHIDYSLYDATRCRINEYLSNHPDCYLNNGYKITIYYRYRFSIPNGDYEDDNAGFATNFLVFHGYSINGHLDQFFYYEDLAVISCVSHYRYADVFGTSNVGILNLSWNILSKDEILEIAEKVPSLDYLCINHWDGDIDELITDIHKVNPDVTLLWIHE